MNNENLAVNGGTVAITTPLPNRGYFGKEEKAAAMAMFDECITSGNAFGYNGKQEELFCQEFATFLGGGYADGVNSGTNSVFVAIRSLELEPFSEVIVGAVNDPGGIMPICMNNCIPIPVDCTPDSYNMDPALVEAAITERTSAIVVPHIGGEPADMPAIMAIATKYNLPVVEDCSQSHAAKINGQYVGTFGTVSAFSIMFGKHFCCGGQGGMVFTKDENQYWKVRRAADRGKSFGLAGSNGNVSYAINCNMDELHAAIGREQLKKLPTIVARRQQVVKLLIDHGLSDLQSITIPEVAGNSEHSYWWWKLKVNSEKLSCTKAEFCAALMAEGVLMNPSYTGALPTTFDWFKERQNQHPWNNPLYKGDSCQAFPIPNALAMMDNYFNLTIYESWGEQEAKAIVAALKKVEAAYLK
ncbi:MAG: DegT/DnrJ/EryC1/StrS family aminotransferase [Victivallaceae bacterium]|nr:DegT/DnrJ/EryC1/StrS family aminotransferase [Victivallaceae bacterium]